jgi:CelD/BcsL family acetyltransferase involved in cellulose biosynthesis/GNAT superfamily N-acetyltransferase
LSEHVQTSVIDSLPALEDALTQPLLSQWEGLLASDPTATLFQSPVWCMPWYRSYSQFDPRVIVIYQGSRLTGVVPLAIEKPGGRLTFAGDNFADYADVVTLPEYREEALRGYLRFARAASRGRTFFFGSTQPESESPAILARLAREFGVRAIVRVNAGWRWWPREQAEDPLKKKSVRYPINYFKRQGELSNDYLRAGEEWDTFKEEYYRQHTLRQVFAGRPASFNNPQKRAFFDELVRTPYAHVCALRLNRELIAGHFGYVFRNVLYWGAPSFDIRYYPYSPGLVQLVLTMKNIEAWGLTGMDLTIGEGDLKERFSTSRVDLPYVEIYPSFTAYYSRIIYLWVMQIVKSAVARWGGGDAWKKHVRPLLARFVGRSRPADGEDTSAPSKPVQLTTLTVTPASIRNCEPRLAAGEQAVFHENQVYDLLQRAVMEDEGARQLTKAARAFPDAMKHSKTFHTLLIDDRLATWGFSCRQSGEASQVVLDGFYTLPEFRGRGLAAALAAHVAQLHFREGAIQASVSIPQDAEAARKAAARAGFVHG